MLIRNSICWVDLCHYRATKTFSLKFLFYRKGLGHTPVGVGGRMQSQARPSLPLPQCLLSLVLYLLFRNLSMFVSTC